MPYDAPISHIRAALDHVARVGALTRSAAFPDFEPEIINPVLEEANRLARNVLAPLNAAGHKQGARLGPEGVIAPDGFKAAYAAFREGGWMGLAFPDEYGGQNLPKALALSVMEMIHGANMAFGLCPLLTFGAIEAILAYGSEEQKAIYLPKLITGEWTGAMNLTEPQAGSDVGALRMQARPTGDGSYSLHGQKIYITWGDHDLAENIVHLVLARLPGAPSGSRGLSLFLAPKFLVNADGSLGRRNAVSCIGLEKKVGVHGSPTCVMSYDGATGWLIGEENHGLAAMFTMMNSARLNVGLEGVAIAEAARQSAIYYALERKQGSAPGVNGPAPIIHHPDIRRSIARITSHVRAARAICYACGAAADEARLAATSSSRNHARLREDLLTPIAKAWSTDRGVEAANINVQIHGGMGFMQETDAAQLYLDARIMPIYEGTNGIQAIDLVSRKLPRDDGAAMKLMVEEIRAGADDALKSGSRQMTAIGESLLSAAAALEETTEWMVRTISAERETALAGASAYLCLAGDVIGGHYLAQLALAAMEAEGTEDCEAVAIAAFFCADTLSGVGGRSGALVKSARIVAMTSDFPHQA